MEKTLEIYQRRADGEMEELILPLLSRDRFKSIFAIADQLPDQPGKRPLTAHDVAGYLSRKVHQGIVERISAVDLGWINKDGSTGKEWPYKSRKIAYRLAIDINDIERTKAGKVKPLKKKTATKVRTSRPPRPRPGYYSSDGLNFARESSNKDKDVAAIKMNLEAPKVFDAMSTGEQRDHLTENLQEAIVNLQVATTALLEFVRKHT